MNPACAICRGACCESLVLNLPPTDSGAWLGFHGTTIGPRQVEFATPCTKLCAGKCSIHPIRPQHCHDFEVGGLDCRATILRRRAKNAQEIFAAMR